MRALGAVSEARLRSRDDDRGPFRGRAAAIVLSLLFFGPTFDVMAGSQTWFVDATEELGLRFTHDPSIRGAHALREIMGSGAALWDYDNDGDLDIYFVQAGPVNRLFRQEPNGRFTDVTAEAGLGDAGYGMGVAIGDIDNDGDLDVFVSNVGRDSLYRNEANGTFSDVSEQAGIDVEGWSTSAVFCDYDQDGFLDLYVARYVRSGENKPCSSPSGRRDYCSPQAFDAVSDLLYRNDGNGSFENVSKRSGIGAVEAPGLGVVCHDLDDDARLDFYVANDGEPNQLWVNDGEGKFHDAAIETGLAVSETGASEAGMGIDLADADGDGALDLFLTHLAGQSNTLYRRDEAWGYSDATNKFGLALPSLPYTGFGTSLGDFDHDGDLDIAVANGGVADRTDGSSGSFLARYAQPNHLMENVDNRGFVIREDDAEVFATPLEVSRGLAAGDIDGDGDLDLLVTNTGGGPRLYRNVASKRGHWLIVRVFDPLRHRDDVGATVVLSQAERQFTRAAGRGRSYLTSGDPGAHFGLPSATPVESLVVVWSDGSREEFPPPTALDKRVELHKGSGRKRFQ